MLFRRKLEALIKTRGRSFARAFFYPANKRARRPGDNSRLYRLRISPFQATPIFATKLLGYSTLAGFMVFDVRAARARARALAEKGRINAIRAIAWRDPTPGEPILTIHAPRRIDDKIEERRPRARRRPALKSGPWGSALWFPRHGCPVCNEKESLTGKPCPPPLSAVITRR